MIRKLRRIFKKANNLKNTFLPVFLFAFFSVNGQAQTKGGVVKNTAPPKTVTGDTYAIIFGISNYPGLTPLKYADKDAALFRDFLETPAGGNTKPENIFFRVNEAAKAADFNVDSYLWLKRKALKEGDRLYIYFSGHGDAMNESNYFLLPYDCTPNNDVNNYLATGLIEMYHVKTLFVKPLVEKKVEVLLIVDACRTNDLPGGQEGQQHFVTDVQSIAEQKEGEIIMLSAGGGQSAIESPKIGDGHGLFTWYLVAGLSGDADKEGDAADHDGKVSFEELASYVKNRVRKEAKTLFNADQVPVFLPPDRDLETIAVVDSGTYNNWKLAETMLQQTNGDGNSLAVVSKKPGRKAVTPGSIADTALIALDNKFIAAIKNGKLLGENSAEDFYNKMAKQWPDQSITDEAKYSLATEFINFGQEKINLYLSGKGITHIQHLENAYKVHNKISAVKGKDSVKNVPAAIEEQIVRMKTIVSTGYDKAAEMMEKAVELLKTDPELLESLYPKLYFLKAGSLQYSSNTSKKKQAIFFVKKAIEKDVTAAYNYELLGDLLHDVDNDSCKIYYQKAMELAPKWAYPENGLGNFYNDKKNHQLAIIHYNNAIRLDTLDEFVYQNIGSMYHNEAKPDSAKKYYLKALSIDSCDFYACANLGSLYKDSISGKQKNNHYFDLSYKYLKKAIACNANYAWAYNKLAQLFDQVNKADSSVYYSNLGIQKNPDNAFLYRSLANEYFNRKDTLNAEKFYAQALAIDSLDVDNYFTLGWYYRRMGLSTNSKFNPDTKITYQKSISNYQKALQLEPGNAIAYNNIGLVYNQQKMYDRALLNYQKAISLDTGYVLAYNNLGNIYYAQKAYDKARLNYEKAIQHDSTFASPYYNLGLIYDNLKAYAKAVQYYQKSLQHDSTDASAYISLGDVYYQQKIYDKANVYYLKAIQMDTLDVTAYMYAGDTYYRQRAYDKAIAYYQKALALEPASGAVYNSIGNVYYDQNIYDKAIANYQKAIHLDPAYTAAYYNLGLVYNALKSYDKSILSLQKAIHLDPADKAAYNLIGDDYHYQKDYENAILNYKKALNIDSAFVKVYNSLGNVYYAQNAYDKAELNYQKAIKLDSTFSSSYYNLGLIYEFRKDRDKALMYYQKAINADSTYSIAYLAVGDIYYNQKIYDKAGLNYEKAAHFEPGNKKAYFYLGDVYHLQKIYDKAILNFQKAVKIDSTYSDAYNSLGNVYYEEKMYDAGILNYQKTIRVDSNFVSAYFNLGLAYGQLKNPDKAILNYQKAIRLDSTFASACFNLALVYDDLKAYDKSIVYYKKANTIDPANAGYLTNLGYAYVYSGDFKNGIPCLNKALSMTINDPWAYYNLACAWSLAKDTGKGIAYLKNALDKGFKDYDHIAQDGDIANLKAAPEFAPLIKQYFPDKVK